MHNSTQPCYVDIPVTTNDDVIEFTEYSPHYHCAVLHVVAYYKGLPETLGNFLTLEKSREPDR